MKSKKWRRRRPVIIKFHSPNGWRCKVKFRWDEWLLIVEAAQTVHQSIEEFIMESINRKAAKCLD